VKAALLAVLLLSGCASLGPQFENRASCAPDGSRLYFHSLYWRFGLTSFVSEEDSRQFCAGR
jgi:hypothetical protein